MINMRGRFAPNGSRVFTPELINERTLNLAPAFATLNDDLMHEFGAQAANYAQPTVLGGSTPPGLGFTFGQSWKRTQMGVMEFSQPVGQLANMEMALAFAASNAFVGKAMRMRTILTCRGLSNSTASDPANRLFDQVLRELNLYKVYREAAWLYYTVGCAPILLPEDGTMNWLQILDPRMIRIMTAYGKTFLYVVIDEQMIKSYNDQKGQMDPRNRDYWVALPASWKKQIQEQATRGTLNHTGESLIKLPDDSYLYLENRFNPVNRKPNDWDGIPLAPYFSACEQYRMAMAAQFASSFLAKNLLALVSVGDPKAEGENYIRPDNVVNNMYMSVFSNPNSAQYIFGDPTLNVRYITPSKDAWASEQLAEPKEALKNLLPSPFWYADSGASFADATVEMRWFLEEIDACNDDFDRNFFLPIYERAAEGRANIAKKHLKAPKHDRSNLVDAAADLAAKSNLYNNGALDIYSLMEAHDFDPDVIMERLRQQKQEAETGVFMPPFEQKQGIVADQVYGIGDEPPAQSGQGGRGGRPNKPGSRPQPEKTTGRTPRPNTGRKK